ncbi:MAG: hypothetical protein ACTSRZ_19425 [Promethearchaeota archaeon]
MREEREQYRSFPFSIYDIFGYLIPGIIFLLMIIMFDLVLIKYANNINKDFIPKLKTPAYSLFKITYSEKIIENWVFSIAYLIIILIVAYVIGHIIASISSLAIDNTLIKKGYRYPFYKLLKLKSTSKEKFMNDYTKGLFFYINVFLFLIIFTITQIKLITDISYYLIFAIILIIYLGILSRHLYIYVTFIRKKNIFSGQNWFDKINMKIIEIIIVYLNIFIRLFNFSYYYFANSLSNAFRTRESFNDDFINIYSKNFKKLFNLDYTNAGTNNYWLCYCFLIDKKKEISNLIKNWLYLYAFARNLSISFYIAYFYSLFLIIINKNLILNKLNILLSIPTCFLLLGIIFLLRYYHIYHSYYTKFIFRSFLYSSNQYK